MKESHESFRQYLSAQLDSIDGCGSSSLGYSYNLLKGGLQISALVQSGTPGNVDISRLGISGIAKQAFFAVRFIFSSACLGSFQ